MDITAFPGPRVAGEPGLFQGAQEVADVLGVDEIKQRAGVGPHRGGFQAEEFPTAAADVREERRAVGVQQELVDHPGHVGRHGGETPLAAAQVVVGAGEFGGAGTDGFLQVFLRALAFGDVAHQGEDELLALRAEHGHARLGRERRAVLAAQQSFEGDWHAGDHVLPAFGGLLGFGVGVDLAHVHRE